MPTERKTSCEKKGKHHVKTYTEGKWPCDERDKSRDVCLQAKEPQGLPEPPEARREAWNSPQEGINLGFRL